MCIIIVPVSLNRNGRFILDQWDPVDRINNEDYYQEYNANRSRNNSINNHQHQHYGSDKTIDDTSPGNIINVISREIDKYFHNK